MANMSYCMFENTANDLRDCILELEDRLDRVCTRWQDNNYEEMLHTERQAAALMARLCEQYLETYSDFAVDYPLRDNF